VEIKMPTYTLEQIENLKLRRDDEQFSQCGSISIDINEFKATFESDPKGAGVYLWVLKDKNKKCKILYVGKAKDGPKSRLSQHKGGINKNTLAAAARRKQISDCIPEGGSLEVFFRESKTEHLPYDKKSVEVSRYSLDEEALILLLNPVLNRSKPPIVLPEQNLIQAIGEEFLSTRPDYSHAWEVCLSELSAGRRDLLEKSIKKFKSHVGNENWHAFDFGVVRGYSIRGFERRPVLVFGKHAKEKFTEKFALLALDEDKKYRDGRAKPDILFFENDDRVSYEDFTNGN
jgi:hypothetical protein